MEDQEDDKIGDFVNTLNELIITCVQSYNHLYDKNVKNFKDNMMKNKSWEEIAKTCNISAEEVQERWKRLKTRYCRQRRLNEQATRSGSGIQTIKQWPLFESMKFMDKHIQRRRNFSNVSLQVGTKSEKNPSDELNFSHQNERGSTSAGQQSPNIAQFNQEFKKVQSRSPESIKMESQVQNKFPEDQLEGSVHGLPETGRILNPQ
ncbi:transcription factor Adf-1-like [Temnothorax curvispinosus]|uniref:Transcription factor Adf-1-like n=1 Tax=Temnothorax curvispinosus TaxID=300111 RepID=A0A6J1QMQ3_9HYME|nr:transcription factor Adf-1-like [Temnothorax curvispinosus]